jgi:hypothetical protein
MATRKTVPAPQKAQAAPKKPARAGKTAPHALSAPAKASRSSPRKAGSASKTAAPAKTPAALPKKRPARSRSSEQPRTLAEAMLLLARARAAAPGPLERAVRADVRAKPSTSPVAASLRQVAYSLARQLDAGAGMAAAAIAKELRATLDQLTRTDDDSDDELEQLISRLSAPMGDAAAS